MKPDKESIVQDAPSPAGARKLGDLLLERGWVTAAQLEEALQEQRQRPAALGTILVAHGWVTAEQLMQALAAQYQMPFVRLGELVVERAVIDNVPVKIAAHYHVVPIRCEGQKLTVAIANPQDVRLLDGLRQALHQRFLVEPVLATADDIERSLKKYYGFGAATVDQLVAASGPSGAKEEGIQDLRETADDASVVKLVNQLILEAYQSRATDIHLEPYRGRVRLRYRIDGLLHDVEVPPSIPKLLPAIISRIKILSNLNIVERRMPQDGRASVKVGGEKLDLRISVLPTPQGENIVIRILPNQMLLDLRELGYRPDDIKRLHAMVQRPYGLVFVTGPTGSGKTTTLYSCLKAINTEERKIITIEDPIEYELAGVTQVQVNPQINFSFAQGLRSLLRHDPDVMMVGEVRDTETAELAIRIALTGHLILSTLHTNDAASSVTRLLDMGIDPYLIVSAVECCVAQRLVRVVCPQCKVEEPSTHAEAKHVMRGRGCEACQRTGFHGRTAIYEILPMTEAIKELVLQRASASAIQRKAVEQGMRTLAHDGWEKVNAGITVPEEILRVTQVAL